MNERWSELLNVAGTQGGYFTARQGKAIGYDRRLLDYHRRSGNLQRPTRGLYRVVGFPLDDADEAIRAILSTRGRDDRPRGVLSHRSALAWHDLSDLFAGSVHLTVPPGFRERELAGVKLHRGNLEPSETTDWLVGRVTTPLRTLQDAANDPSVPTEQLGTAMRDALEKGLVTRKRLEAASTGRLAKAAREMQL